MKKVKYVFWLVVIALVALVAYQNQDIFMVRQSLRIDLQFFKKETPELIAGVYYLAVFLIGMLISYVFTLAQKFRDRKTIRQLNERVAASEKKLAALQSAPAETQGAQQESPQSRQSQAQQQQGPSREAVSEAGGEKNEEKPGE